MKLRMMVIVLVSGLFTIVAMNFLYPLAIALGYYGWISLAVAIYLVCLFFRWKRGEFKSEEKLLWQLMSKR